MSFFDPINCSEYHEDKFSIRSFNYPEDFSREIALIYDIPHDMSVKMGQFKFPGDSFDYFNPLIITNDTVKKIKFCMGVEVVRSFTCMELSIPKWHRERIDHFLKIHPKTFAYSPIHGITYPSMTVAHLGMSHVDQVFDFLRRTPPAPVDSQIFERLVRHFMNHPEIPDLFFSDGDTPVPGQEL